MKTAEIIKSNKRNVSNLPVKIPIDDLQDYGDILIFEGMKRVKGVIEEPDNQDTLLRAINTVVGINKYVVQRKKVEADMQGESVLEDDLGDILG